MKIISISFILLLFSGCVFEGKPNFLYFNILNSTNDTVTIAHHSKDCPTCDCNYDTLLPGKQLEFFESKMSCLSKNQLDSIFTKTFDSFYVSCADSDLNNTNLFDHNNWQEISELEKKIINKQECFVGKITFKLTLQKKNVKH